MLDTVTDEGDPPVRGHGWRSAPLPPGWEATRTRILERDGYRCQIVGCPRPARDVDHVVPTFEGGGDEDENLRSLCPPHHRQKSGREAARARLAKRSRKRKPEPHPGILDS